MRFLQSAIEQPTMQNQIQEKSLIATAGGIFGYNPYFCDSFAIAQLDYLPTLPIHPHPFIPLAELRYLISNTDAYAISLGVGFRNYFSPIRSTLGGNVFYDIKHTDCATFYQMGLGLECLSFLEIRANVYLPITKHVVIRAAYNYPGGYQVIGKNMISNFGGWEVELGKRFVYEELCDLYLSIAPYFLFGKEQGIEYNGLVRWKSILFVGVQVYQNISCGTSEIAGTIGINIPLDNINIFPKNSLNEIPISRWETIRTNTHPHYKKNY